MAGPLSEPWDVTMGPMPGRDEWLESVGVATEDANNVKLPLYKDCSEDRQN
jgi:hypothetical protein